MRVAMVVFLVSGCQDTDTVFHEGDARVRLVTADGEEVFDIDAQAATADEVPALGSPRTCAPPYLWRHDDAGDVTDALWFCVESAQVTSPCWEEADIIVQLSNEGVHSNARVHVVEDSELNGSTSRRIFGTTDLTGGNLPATGDRTITFTEDLGDCMPTAGGGELMVSWNFPETLVRAYTLE